MLGACLPVIFARVGCQSSGPGSHGISPPTDGIRDIPGSWICSPTAEAWRGIFRLLFLFLMEVVVPLRQPESIKLT